MSAPARVIYLAEPAPQYLVRPPIVVDCSMLCAVLFDEPERDAALAHLAGKQLLAPRLLDHEMIHVALRKCRGGMPETAVKRSLDDYLAQQIEFADTAVEAQYQLAQRYGLSGYDAAYLWLADEMKAPLATFDRRLGEAAQRHLRA